MAFHAVESGKSIVVMATKNYELSEVPNDWKPVESLLTGPKTVSIETPGVASLLKNVRTNPDVNKNYFYSPLDTDFYPKILEPKVTVTDWNWADSDLYKASSIVVEVVHRASRPKGNS